MPTELVKRTMSFVKAQLLNEPTGHDWYHTKRVLDVAKKIQAVEGGDLELVEMSALLHDMNDYKQLDFDLKKGALVLRGMMDTLDIPEDLGQKILIIAQEAMFLGDDTTPPSTLEGKIVQDADWVDSIGAIGIARVFATGGRLKRMIYDPEIPVRKKLSKDVHLHKKNKGTSVNFFYEKTFKLPEMMNTKTGHNFVKEKLKFTKMFVDQFLQEWDLKI